MSRQVRLCWELLRLSLRHERVLGLTYLAVQVLDVVAFAGVALALATAVDNASAHVTGVAVAAGAGAALGYAGSWLLGAVAVTLRLQLIERIGLIELDRTILRVVTGIDGMAHLERTDFLDRVTVLRGAAWGIMNAAWGALESAFGIGRLTVTLFLLGTINPWLLLLPVFAAVPLLFDRRASLSVRDAEMATAEAMRLQRHLFDLTTDPDSGKEIRISGGAAELTQRQQAAWNEAINRRFRAHVTAAIWKAAGWALFTVGFVAGLVLVVAGTVSGQGSAGDVVLAITVAANLRYAVQQTVSRVTAVTGQRRLLDPYLWLRDYGDQEHARSAGTQPVPATLRHGITFQGVTYSYPGSGRLAIDSVSMHLRAGTVVAVVGEYGSGKTTLVKLLCKFYEPDAGEILVDGTDLRQIATDQWRSRMSVAFQDYGRYQTSLREAVALGDIKRANERTVNAALAAADAQSFVADLPQGIDTQLGKKFGGVDLSEGQWQKTALARACLPERPLLFALDEPTASLDALSEHAIFERYMARARALAAESGAITLVVSHRFSTVASADLIVVVQDGRVVEIGSHKELLDLGGNYAELYGIQADAYAGGDAEE